MFNWEREENNVYPTNYKHDKETTHKKGGKIIKKILTKVMNTHSSTSYFNRKTCIDSKELHP